MSNIWSFPQSVAAMHWEDIPIDKQKTIHRKIQQIVHNIKDNKPHFYLCLKTRIVFMTMRTMHKKGMSANNLDYQYWNEQG